MSHFCRFCGLPLYTEKETMNSFRRKTTIPLARNSINRSPLRYGLFLIPLLLAAFALSPTAQAQLSPPPDGGYAGDNTAEGTDALFSNTTGTENTAIGFDALFSNTTADGHDALFSNTTAIRNTATGSFALFSNTTGPNNTALGYFALFSNTTGNSNMASGYDALLNNTTGSGNIALGNFAGANLTTGDQNIDIGNVGVAAEADTIRIGTQGNKTNAYLAGVYQTNIVNGLVVKVDAEGHLGTVGSSERFKDTIKPMDKASEAILALKPVTFHYKKELDPEGTPQFGLIAEQVERVNPDLVVRDADGKVYTVRYEAVNAMLLNEFLKEHRTVQGLKGTVAQQQKQIEALTATVQKVSEKIKLDKTTPQLVADRR